MAANSILRCLWCFVFHAANCSHNNRILIDHCQYFVYIKAMAPKKRPRLDGAPGPTISTFFAKKDPNNTAHEHGEASKASGLQPMEPTKPETELVDPPRRLRGKGPASSVPAAVKSKARPPQNMNLLGAENISPNIVKSEPELTKHHDSGVADPADPATLGATEPPGKEDVEYTDKDDTHCPSEHEQDAVTPVFHAKPPETIAKASDSNVSSGVQFGTHNNGVEVEDEAHAKPTSTCVHSEPPTTPTPQGDCGSEAGGKSSGIEKFETRPLQHEFAASSDAMSFDPPMDSADATMNIPSCDLHADSSHELSRRRQILAKMFKWSFLAADILYRFATHPLRDSARSSRESLCKVLTGVRTHVQNSLPSFFDRFDSPKSAKSTCNSDSHGCADHVRINYFNDLRNKIAGTTLSTCFSGVDTPCTSLMMIAWAVGHESGFGTDDMVLPRNLFAVEKFSKSRDELLVHPHPAEHLFTDVEDFWHPCVRQILKDKEPTEELLETVIIPAVLSGKAATDSAFCCKHNRYCKVGSGSQRQQC